MTCGALPCGNSCLIIGTYTLCIGGFDFGSTTGGLTLSRNAEYVDVRNDQSCSRQFRYLKQQDWTFTTTLQDLCLDRLRVIYGMGWSYTDPSGNVSPTLSSDGNTLTIAEDQSACGIGGTQEYDVAICGPGPGCGCRVIDIPRVLITPETLDYTISKDNPTQLEVEFTVLPECETGILFTMTDQCTAPDCSTEDIPTGPTAIPSQNGEVPPGEQVTGSLDILMGTNPDVTYELIEDETNPDTHNITIDPDGSYTITN